MNENEEIFVDIDGYEGKYKVSNLGNVKSLIDSHGNPREKILKQIKDKFGYLHVILCKNGNIKNCKVHRLVAKAFIPNPNNLPTVNHINEDKTDNRVYNLEWMNMSQQQRHGTCQQRRVASTNYTEIAEKLTNRQDLSKQVYQYSLDLKLIKIWKSTAECGRNGYGRTAIASCCNGKRKSHKNFIWSYIELKKGE